jgi:hypothetical protein
VTHSELTGKIIGCAMEVHKTLGNGFREVIYQRALDIEMKAQGLTASREHEMDIFGNRSLQFKRVMKPVKNRPPQSAQNQANHNPFVNHSNHSNQSKSVR